MKKKLLLHNQIFQNINNYSNKKKDKKAYLQKVEIIIPRWHSLHILYDVLQIAGLTDIVYMCFNNKVFNAKKWFVNWNKPSKKIN